MRSKRALDEVTTDASASSPSQTSLPDPLRTSPPHRPSPSRLPSPRHVRRKRHRAAQAARHAHPGPDQQLAHLGAPQLLRHGGRQEQAACPDCQPALLAQSEHRRARQPDRWCVARAWPCRIRTRLTLAAPRSRTPHARSPEEEPASVGPVGVQEGPRLHVEPQEARDQGQARGQAGAARGRRDGPVRALCVGHRRALHVRPIFSFQRQDERTAERRTRATGTTRTRTRSSVRRSTCSSCRTLRPSRPTSSHARSRRSRAAASSCASSRA